MLDGGFMKKRNLLIILIIAICISLFAVALVGCDKDGKEEVNKQGKTGLYFKPQSYASTVYAIDIGSMSTAEWIAVQSVQGILAQDKAAIFIIDDKGSTEDLLNKAAATYGFKVERVYDAWTLINKFRSSIEGSKFVLYNMSGEEGASYADQSLNYATTVAGAERYLMVSSSLREEAEAQGYTLGKDVREGVNTRDIFEEYKDVLNKSYLVHQSPVNGYLRDYAIAGKAMCFYSDFYDGDNSVKEDILKWADVNAPILGWTENEINFVASNSLMSKITIAADWCANLSFYATGERDYIEQTNYEEREIEPEEGKHYVAIVMSDGDNVQWMTRDFETDSKYYGSDYRGEFPMTWTTSPSLYDLAPEKLNSLYSTANANEQFIAGPSGVGYINATDYSASSLDEYAAYTAGYMQKTDIEYVNFLDNYVNADVLDTFSAYEQIKGGIWSVGDKYIEGNGSLYWSGDKPFLCARETLWRIAGDDYSNQYYGYVERVAQRINEYEKDYTSVNGYTVVLAHAWSIGTMDYLNRFVQYLDEDVVLVTVGEMLDMITKYVPHENADVQDIAPSDIPDDQLAPISSDQYDWDRIKDTETLDQKEFVFSSKRVASLWNLGTGGLEYDYAGWVASDSTGQPAVELDGSDLEDVLDPLPNAWMYAAFDISEDADKDNVLVLKATGGVNADVNMRVRVLYEENGKYTYSVLDSDDYDSELDSFGWYKRKSGSPVEFVYDISAFKGKRVIISIEQDDTGDGSGEIVYVNAVQILGEEVQKEESNKWDVTGIASEWNNSGSVATHSEGFCLEVNAAGETSSVSKTVTITAETAFVKFYIRMFVRSDNPDTPALLKFYVNGELLRGVGAASDSILVSSDNYRCLAYDLSAYIGQTIEIKLESEQGQHAAIGKILMADDCTIAETRKLYSTDEVRAM